MNIVNYYDPSTKTIYTPKSLSNMGITDDIEVLKTLNIYPLKYDIPEYDRATEKLITSNIVFNPIENEYHQTFIIKQLTLEELNINIINETEDLFMKLRHIRNIRITDTTWLIERHRDEKESNSPTTLSETEYTELLNYRQALRDITEQEGAPWDGGGINTPWPSVPNFIL